MPRFANRTNGCATDRAFEFGQCFVGEPRTPDDCAQTFRSLSKFEDRAGGRGVVSARCRDACERLFEKIGATSLRHGSTRKAGDDLRARLSASRPRDGATGATDFATEPTSPANRALA